jgi:hypothetical protein
MQAKADKGVRVRALLQHDTIRGNSKGKGKGNGKGDSDSKRDGKGNGKGKGDGDVIQAAAAVKHCCCHSAILPPLLSCSPATFPSCQCCCYVFAEAVAG